MDQSFQANWVVDFPFGIPFVHLFALETSAFMLNFPNAMWVIESLSLYLFCVAILLQVERKKWKK